jgi:hypothetical protein
MRALAELEHKISALYERLAMRFVGEPRVALVFLALATARRDSAAAAELRREPDRPEGPIADEVWRLLSLGSRVDDELGRAAGRLLEEALAIAITIELEAAAGRAAVGAEAGEDAEGLHLTALAALARERGVRCPAVWLRGTSGHEGPSPRLGGPALATS